LFHPAQAPAQSWCLKAGFRPHQASFFYPNVVPGNFPVEDKSVTLAFERAFSSKVPYVQAADMDGDGLTDVIAGIENPARIIIERNISTSDSIQFSDSLSFSLGANPYIIEIAELNGDGKADIVVVSNRSNIVQIFLNYSSPGNLSFVQQTSISITGNAYDIAIADFDGDGKQDIVTGPGPDRQVLEFFRNINTESSISFSKVLFSPPVVPFIYYFTCGDYDNDGKPDLIVGSGSLNNAYILRNTSNGPGSFSFTSSTMILSFADDFEAGTTDLNRDGKQDIVISSRYSSPKVFLNSSTGTTIQFQAMNYTGNTSSEGFVSFTDLNADGNPEIMAGSYEVWQRPGIYENLYPNLPLFESSLINLRQFLNSVGADFNQDGKTDLLCSGSLSNRYQVFSNQSVPMLISNFSPKRATSGTPVTIKGQGFSDIVSVSFGNVNATSFQIINDSTITAVAGNGASGNVMVSATGKTATLAGFTYFTKPVLQSFAPSTGFKGSEVMLNGTNMQEVRQVRFGSVTADTFFILSNIQVRAIVGNGASGEITIAGSDWDSSKLGGFTFLPAPVITGINSLKVPPDGEVVLSGNYFNPLQGLTIGGINVNATSATPNSIRFKAPAQFIGGSIVVKTAYGTDTIYGFYNGATISSVSPLTGKKGDTVTIKGSGFINTPSAIFVTIAKQKAEVIETSSNQIKIIVPSGPATGAVSLSMNGHTISAPLPFLFSFNGEGATVDRQSFQSFSPFEVLKTGVARNFKIADLDMDGKQDILQMTSHNFIVYRNTGQPGLFSFQEISFNNFAGYFEGEFEIQDMNHDGKPDIIVNTYSGSRRFFYTNQCTPGTIKFSEPRFNQFQNNDYYLQLNDMDKDGRIDLFSNKYLYLNESSLDSFSFYNRLDLNIPETFDNKLFICDMDGDEELEFFSLQPPSNNINFNKIEAIPGKIAITESNQQIPFSCESFANFAADLNNDGKIDLVEFCNSNYIQIFKNISIPGNIQFSTSTLPQETDQYSVISRLGDFNGDGKLDFLTFDPSKLIYLYINSTTGSEITFLPPVSLPVFDYPDGWEGDYQFEVADLDNDGRIDIIVSGKQLETVQIFRNLTGTQIPLFVCKDQPATITAQGTGSSYQWQQSINGGTFSNLANGNGFSGVQSSILNIASVNESFNGKLFRCLVNGVAEIPYSLRLFNKWLGTTNNLWSEPSNWSCGSVPFGNIEVEINGEVEIDLDVTIGRIILKPGGKVNVAAGKKLTVLH
jgi:hypothetical protein